MIGETVGQYRIVDRLPRGGMGVVYKAEDIQLNRFVALKYLPAALSADETAKARFRREAKAASAIDHPNICTILGFEQTPDGRECIVMPFYEGESVKDKIAAGPLVEKEAVDIAQQTAAGLGAAHARGVVHRDIKSANLVVTTDGRVKIVDFGLAVLTGTSRVTAEGKLLGTLAYMSPEQTRGDEADARCDLWALGVVLYEMLCGRLPFRGAAPEVIIHRIRNEAPDPFDADVSPAMRRIITKALAKNPAERYQDAAAFSRDLATLPRPGWRMPSRRTALAAAAIVVVALAALSLPENFFDFGRAGDPVAARAAIRSVAVLPFRNRGAQRDYDYVGAGLADVLTAKLTRAGLLEVRSIQALRLGDSTVEAGRVARELGVDAALSGTYQVESAVLSLTYTLVAARDGVSVTGDVIEVPFDRTIEAERRIAVAVVSSLGGALSEDARAGAAASVTSRNDAFQAYLRSQYALELFWRSPEVSHLSAAQRALESAISLDPGFSLAKVRLVFVNWVASFWGYLDATGGSPAQDALAQDAISRDPSFGDAYAVKALLSFQRGDLPQMRTEIRAALDRSPSSALAHYSAGWYYLAAGLGQRSVDAFTRADELEPELVRRELGIAFRYAGDFARAERQFRDDLEMFPGDVATQANLGLMLVLLDRVDEAVALHDKIAAASPNDPTVQALFAVLNVRRGRRFDIDAWLTRHRDVYWEDGGYAFSVAGLYGLARRPADAVVWLNRARERGFRNYPYADRYPFFTSIRTDTMFQSAMANLRQEWEQERSAEEHDPLIRARQASR
jgi:eukaryotic-like serine/threonine-protein kinase